MKTELSSQIHILPKIIITTFFVIIIIISLILTQLPLSSQNKVFANHGQEVLLSLDSGQFQPLTSGKGKQVKVLVNYTTQDQSIINQTAISVMKVYAMNGTLLKTSSSSATGLILHNFGTEQLATTFPNNTLLQNVTAVITFTSIQSLLLSNTLTVKLNFGQTII